MMRSMYSAIAGLRAHQTKMDVIGNNIANVNTAGFRASNVVFADVYYQTTQAATGANPTTGKAGQNAKQIGLGSKLSSISANMSTQGGAQATDNALDLMLSGDGFFILNDGGTNYFTKAGAFTVDAAGTLCAADGAKVMGWQVGPDGEIVKAQVSPLNVMSADNLYSEPEATTQAFVSGNIDNKDPQLPVGAEGAPLTVSFYDNLGYSYTAVFAIHATDTSTGTYTVSLTDILDSKSESILSKKTVAADGTVTYAASGVAVALGGTAVTPTVNAADGTLTFTGTSPTLKFNPSSGLFSGIGAAGSTESILNMTLTQTANSPFPPTGIDIDFSSLTQFSTSGVANVTSTRGDKVKGTGAGTAFGNMKGLKVDTSGKIYGTYDNGTEKLLGQIAVATFSNPAGLEAVGNSRFAETQNSGEFNGIGSDVSVGGGSMSTGYLEMSNVDLANEFTSMITTQRGFQANSRIITVSDTLLEELVNLKR